MGKRIDWDRVKELKEMIKGQGLELSEGADKFGIPVWQLYESNRRHKDEDGGRGVDVTPETVPSAEPEDLPTGRGLISQGLYSPPLGAFNAFDDTPLLAAGQFIKSCRTVLGDADFGFCSEVRNRRREKTQEIR